MYYLEGHHGEGDVDRGHGDGRWAPDRAANHPTISLRYWKEDSGNEAGTGKTLTCSYSRMDAPFDHHWEILYDW